MSTKAILRKIKHQVIKSRYIIFLLIKITNLGIKIQVLLNKLGIKKFYFKNYACYQNNFYGIEKLFRQICKINTASNAYIEHGFYFYHLPETKNYNLNKIICFSKYKRKKIAKKTFYEIGPYIQYVNLKNKPKKKYLLIVPGHDSKTWQNEKSLLHFKSYLSKKPFLKKLPKLILTNPKNITDYKTSFTSLRAVYCGGSCELDHLIKLKKLLAKTKIIITDCFTTLIAYAEAEKIPVVLLQRQNKFYSTSQFEKTVYAKNIKEIVKKEKIIYKYYNEKNYERIDSIASFVKHGLRNKPLINKLFGIQNKLSKKDLTKVLFN